MKFRSLLLIMSAVTFLSSCNDDDAPPAENEEEIINEVVLSFTPAVGGNTLVYTYSDPDGEGTTAPTIDEIVLSANTVYHLTIEFKNTVGDADENLTEEIRAEGDEHQIFFGWTGPLFNSPTGLGNIGDGSQGNEIIYQDEDANGLPIGLSTLWETKDPTEATFRVVLKHQPGIKSQSSSSSEGATDVDITWNFKVQ